MNTDNKELKIFGLNMIKISLIYSVFLIIWGFAVTFMSDSESLTSFIPTVLGSVILILATLSFKMPGKQKIFMHIVVIFGFIIFDDLPDAWTWTGAVFVIVCGLYIAYRESRVRK